MVAKVRLSYSSISTYKQCPYRWKKKYIDGIKEPMSEAQAEGHRFEEELLKGIDDKRMFNGISFESCHTQLPLTCTINYDDGITIDLIGIVDLVIVNKELATVIDIKRPKDYGTWNEKKALADAQVPFYCELVKNFLKKETRGFYYCCNKKDNRIRFLPAGKDCGTIIADAYQCNLGITQEIFHPKQNFMCTICPYFGKCTEGATNERTD